MAYASSKYTQHDISAIKASIPLLNVVQEAGVELKKQGREWIGLSPFKYENTPSFFVDPQKGVFKCFASGEGGDVIRFVQLFENCDFSTALTRLKERAGLFTSEAKAQAVKRFEQQKKTSELAEQKRKQRNICRAQEIWASANSAEHTPVETYLLSRGINLDVLQNVYGWRVPRYLRYLELPIEDLGHVPSMVGVLTKSFSGNVEGVHRTYLTRNGTHKASIPTPKMTLGSVWGSLGWLYTPHDHKSGDKKNAQTSPTPDTLILGEGYETTLSVMSVLARHGKKVYAASAISLNNLAGAGLGKGDRHPHIEEKRLPSTRPDPARPGIMLTPSSFENTVKHILILQDADGKDALATDAFVRRAAGKFKNAGFQVRVAMPELGKDFNDMVGEAA
ncbi:MAG: CHC2 zinc finger domain-containing protein [Pseudomonadota bacterium]